MSARHLNQIDLARRWTLSHRTLERWRRMGAGPAFLKLGGRVVYRREDVEAFEALHLRSAAEAASRQQVHLTAVPPAMAATSLRRG